MTHEFREYFSLDNMLTLGVLTGSRAFNCSSEDSDWDIVITWDYLLINGYFQIPTLTDCVDFSRSWDEFALDADGIECAKEMYEGSIWGPINTISRYTDYQGNSINLFICNSEHANILPRFTELNFQMNFLYGHEIADKNIRIERFIELTNKLGITTFKE